MANLILFGHGSKSQFLWMVVFGMAVPAANISREAGRHFGNKKLKRTCGGTAEFRNVCGARDGA